MKASIYIIISKLRKKYGDFMIKGNQKKVIHVKNTESGIFEEAYFILKEDISKNLSEGDIISEANRIIEENGKNEAVSAKGKYKYLFMNILSLLSSASAMVLAVLLLVKNTI